MKIYRICAIGHRYIDDPSLDTRIERCLTQLFEKHEFTEAFIGRNGDFDISFASVFRKVRRNYNVENHRLTLVLPYNVKDEEFYSTYYDDIILPISKKVHYKRAIIERNKWMVDKSDILSISDGFA